MSVIYYDVSVTSKGLFFLQAETTFYTFDTYIILLAKYYINIIKFTKIAGYYIQFNV